MCKPAASRWRDEIGTFNPLFDITRRWRVMSMDMHGCFGKRGLQHWPQVLLRLRSTVIRRMFDAKTPSDRYAGKQLTGK